MAKSKLTIEFDNESALEHFASWLSEMGEQNYWDWMEYREQEEDGDITAISFNYHGNKKNPIGEDFLSDLTIRTVCSRLDRER